MTKKLADFLRKVRDWLASILTGPIDPPPPPRGD